MVWNGVHSSPTDTLIAGEGLFAGQQLDVSTLEFSALMRGDGNLVVYRTNDWSELWSSGTGGNPGAFVQLHEDGRLAVLSFYRDLLWSSDDTGTNSPRCLRV